MPAAPDGAAALAAPLIRITNVSKRFGSFTAVDNVSLEIMGGEFFALLGPSGCGKTTLLRMLAGFESPSAGTIAIDGVDMAAVPPYQRPVNMMFQSYALFPHMSVSDNIAFGLKQDGVARADCGARVAEMLALVQLDSFAKRRPHQLSGGQRQRVALARALVKRPKLLLLDEPLAALDKNLREATQFELVNIQESTGVTFVVVTHDQEEAMTMAGRMAIMHGGQVKQVAPPHEIYEYPNSRLVADFVGSVNIFEGRIVTDESDHVHLRGTDVACLFEIDHGISTAPGATAWVAIRPEKITIARRDGDIAPATTPTNSLAGIVDDIGYLGAATIYHVRLADGRIVRASEANRARRREHQITWEDPVTLSWTPEAGVVLAS